MKPARHFCVFSGSASPAVIVASSGQHITPAQEAQMPGQNTSPDPATLRQDSPPNMVATNTIAALLTGPRPSHPRLANATGMEAMSVHSYHPDTHTHGLADDCPRCAEHAQHPERSLDVDNLSALVYRIQHELPARSDNEARAMDALRDPDRER